MVILSCNSISKSFGINSVLENVTFNLRENDKIGMVGINGAGKSTIFKIISGQISPDSGEIYKAKEIKIGYLAQHYTIDSDNTIWDELLGVFKDLINMNGEIKKLENEIESTKDVDKLDALVKKHANLCGEFENKNGYGFESRIKGVLIGLGFTDVQFVSRIKTLSGGQKTRVALAKILLENPNVLLLDEPTNHLDIQAIEWLEDYLSRYNGSVIVISHDRYFLDKISNRTIEIENKRANIFEGNYSFYIRHKEEEKQQQLKHYNVQQKEIKHLENIIEQQRQWNREKSIKKAESTQKRLDKVERIEKSEYIDTIDFKFIPQQRSGNDVISVENLSKTFDKNTIFKDVNFEIKRGEKVFLLGENGTGKTTILKILLDKIQKSFGTIKWGSNVITGYYDQEQADINIKNTPIDEIWDANPKLTQTQIRNALAVFLFKGDDVFKSISSLSGGERARVALVKLMLSKANFLLLDEPTNHLDISSCEALEKALMDYEGTLFVVSHDRYFINKIATRIIELTSLGVNNFLGNYDYYFEKKQELKSKVKSDTKSEKVSNTKNEYIEWKKEKANERKVKKMLEEVENEIYSLENQIADYEKQLCEPEIYSDHKKALEITTKIDEGKKRLEKLYEKWQEFELLV